jgi:hypothetical protein
LLLLGGRLLRGWLLGILSERRDCGERRSQA